MFCVEVWTVVPLVGSLVVCCVVRWPVVVWPSEEVMLLLLEKLKEEVLVKLLLEDMVAVGVLDGLSRGLIVDEVAVVAGEYG